MTAAPKVQDSAAVCNSRILHWTSVALVRGESLGVFGRLGIGNIGTEDALRGEFWHDVHVRLTYVLYAAVAAHVLGAIVHQIFGVRREVDGPDVESI
jgi:hypothetical protein